MTRLGVEPWSNDLFRLGQDSRILQKLLIGMFLILAAHALCLAQDAEWDRYMDAGGKAITEHRNSDAEQAYRQAWELAEKNWKHDARISAALLKLAEACNSEGKRIEAISFAKQSVVTLDEALKFHKAKNSTEEYQQFAVSAVALDKVGDLLAANNEYASAEDAYKRVVKIWERAAANAKAVKPTNEDFFKFMIQTLDDAGSKASDANEKLGGFYFANRKFEAAIPVYQRSIELRNAKPGSVSLSSASSMSFLAASYASLSQYEEAEPVFQRLIALLEGSELKNGVEMASTLENYSLMLKKVHRDAEAEKVSERANAIRSRLTTSVP